MSNADEPTALASTAEAVIRQPAETKQAIQSAFDGSITYDKGSSLVKMFESLVGPAIWRDFMRAYMTKYAWRNVTSEDFIGTMSERLGESVAVAVRSLLEQPGVPLIEHRLRCEGTPRIALKQRALPWRRRCSPIAMSASRRRRRRSSSP